MSIRTAVADWVVSRLLRGERPGGRRVLKLLEPSGVRSTWLFDGDAIEIFYADSTEAAAKVVVRVSITPDNAVRLARFILVWWADAMWHGWKLRLWAWATHVRLENSGPVVLPDVICEVPHPPVIARRGSVHHGARPQA